MNNCKLSSYREKQKPKLSPRLERTGIKRHKQARAVQIVRNLGDRSVFPRVHRFRSDPNRFAIHSHIPVGEHGLLSWEGTVYKVAAVDRFEIGTMHGAEYYYEIKTVVWKRYQNPH